MESRLMFARHLKKKKRGREGSKREAGLAIKELQEGSLGDGKARYLDCIHVNILAVI